MPVPRSLTPTQRVSYRRWIAAGKGRAQAAKLALSPKAGRRP